MNKNDYKKELITKIQTQLESDLQKYNIGANTNLTSVVDYHKNYGNCIKIYNQNNEKINLIYIITSDGLLNGTNSQTFCASHIKCENIAIHYLCKLIRTFN